MGTGGHDLAFRQKEQALAVDDRGQAVGDHDDGLSAAYMFNRLGDFRLSDVIQSRRCLVQHDDGRIAKQATGQGQTLALTAGHLHAAFADHRIIAVGKGHDVVVNAGGLTGFDHLFVRQVAFHRGQVVPDAHIEQIRHLANHGDAAADGVLIQRLDGYAID